MRLERSVAAVVTAAGLLMAGAIHAAEQQEAAPKAAETGTATAPATDAKPAGQFVPLTSPLYNPWTPAPLKTEHQLLAKLVGKAQTVMHVEQGPYPRNKETQGTAEAKLIMNGLFLQVTQTGTRMKESFERIITYGFDPMTAKYTAELIDSTSPISVHFSGPYDPVKREFNLTAKYHEPGGNRFVTARLVTRFVDDKIWSYEEFLSPGKDQPERQLSLVMLTRN